MFHFRASGYLLTNAEAFECHAVGYLSGSSGISAKSSYCSGTPVASTTHGVHGNVELYPYCGVASNKLVLRLEDPNNSINRWHASDVTLDFVAGDLGYMQSAADSLGVLAVETHPDSGRF